MVEDTELAKRRSAFANELAEWLERFDDEFAARDMRPSDRPLEAVLALLRHGSIQIRRGGEAVDLASPAEHVGTDWFRELYATVNHWYERRLGREAIRHRGVFPLDGAVLVRGVPFRLAVPAHRSRVEKEGESAWLYFDDGVGEGEEPARWIEGGPPFENLDDGERDQLVRDAGEVAGALRFVEYRRMGGSAGPGYDEEAGKLVVSTSTYLRQAARRIVSGEERERGPAWFDLQMASESSLKAVIRQFTGKQPHIHDLSDLLGRARTHGVAADDGAFDGWPDFRTVSDWRYGQGEPWGLSRLYAGYRSALLVARSALAAIPIPMRPGFGLLLRYPIWLARPGKPS